MNKIKPLFDSNFSFDIDTAYQSPPIETIIRKTIESELAKQNKLVNDLIAEKLGADWTIEDAKRRVRAIQFRDAKCSELFIDGESVGCIPDIMRNL